MCTGGHTTHDLEFYKHSIDYNTKFHASYLEKNAMQRPVLSRFEPTFYGCKVFFLALGHSALILDGSTLVLFLFSLFEELVWNESRDKSNAWCLIAQLIQNEAK